MQNKLNKVLGKILASVLVIALTAGNLMLIGSSMVAFAGENLEAQNEKTQHQNVEFGAYFKSEGKNVHSLICSANEKLYIHLNVKEAGYLKSGKIKIEGANYEIAGELENSEVIGAKNGNSFTLKQIQYGTEAILEIPIALKNGELFNVDDVQKDSSVTLTGIYVTSEGEQIDINKTVTLNLAWDEKTEILAGSEIVTYKTFYSNEDSGIIVQEKITLEKTKGVLPVNKTNIEIDAVKYAEKLPETVTVNSTKTQMTNGKTHENVELSYNYNKNTGKVEIEVINKQNDGQVYSKQGGKDEFIITYEYGKEAYESKQEEIKIELNSNVTVESYVASNENKQAKANIKESKVVTNEFGYLVNGEISIANEINKAKIYANYNSNKRFYETEYNVKEVVNIVKPSLTNEIIIESIPESFVDIDGNENTASIENVDYTRYNTTKIAEKNFKEILGENGSLTIENKNGKEIGKIDSTTIAKDGVYEIIYSEKPSRIKIVTSTPIAKGNLVLEHSKAIKADVGYSKEEVLGFVKLRAKTNVGTKEEMKQIVAEQNLTEPSSNLKLQSNKDSINNTQEEIELKVELGNNNENSILYNNPTVKITFPSFVENVEVKNTNLLFEDELEISKVSTVNEENGSKAVLVNLIGTQTEFSEMANGATIVLGANITSKKEKAEGEIFAQVNESKAEVSLASNLKAETTKAPVILKEEAEQDNKEETTEETKPRISVIVDSLLNIVEENETITYLINISDITDYEKLIVDANSTFEIKNLVVKNFLPSGVTYKSASIEKYNIDTGKYEERENVADYDVKNRVVTWDIGNMQEDEQIMLILEVTAESLNKGVYEKEIENKVIASYEGMNNIESNISKVTIAKPYLNITKTTENINNINKEGDIVKFILEARNVGGNTADDVKVDMVLPEELEPASMKYGVDTAITNMSQSDNNIDLVKVDLEPGSLYYIEVEAKIKELPEEYKEQYKKAIATATINNEETTWEINIENSNYVADSEQPSNPEEPNNPENPSNPEEPNNPENPSNPEEPNNPEQPNDSDKAENYTISGLAWLDENKNGIKEEGEELLSKINVALLQNSKKIKEVQTDSNGKYYFAELKEGEYQIAFKYNDSLYSITEYRKTGKLEINSNAIETKAGEAITDIVKVVDKDVQHINIGLIKIPTFDMSLNKVVSRIIVQNSKETKEYKYDNSYAKLDINGKLLNETVVLVEYKITIKNEGELAGKVKKIVDYVPRDMTFSTEMNNTWVQDSNGNLYNSELKDISIEPGETKEITLILRKKMTDENTGLINNTAEIVEVQNGENIKDKDSTPNNKVQGEDDMSSADVLIGVKTGAEVIYTTLGIIILIILSVGIYLINKEVLRK